MLFRSKISRTRGVMRFGKSGKLSPRYVGPFEILKRVGEVAYQLALPPTLTSTHDVFHVSMLKKYVSDASHNIDYADLEIREDMSYVEVLVKILDRKHARTTSTAEYGIASTVSTAE